MTETSSEQRRWYAMLMLSSSEADHENAPLLHTRHDESILSLMLAFAKVSYLIVNLIVSRLCYLYSSFTVPAEGVECKLLILICIPRCTILVLSPVVILITTSTEFGGGT